MSLSKTLYPLVVLRAIPEKIPGGGAGGGGGGGVGEEGKRYIFLWAVGADNFQIIWVIGA